MILHLPALVNSTIDSDSPPMLYVIQVGINCMPTTVGLILAWMYSTSELDELFQILNSVKGFKLNNHKGTTQHDTNTMH